MEAVSKQTDFLLENGVVFSSRFESGNLENVQIKEPNTYHLWIQADPNSTYRTWFYFSIENVPTGTTVVFCMVNMSNQVKLFKEGHLPVYCTEHDQHWNRIHHPIQQNGVVKGEEGFQLTFKHSFCNKSKHYFAFSYPWTYTQNNLKIKGLIDKFKDNYFCDYRKLCLTHNKVDLNILTITKAAGKHSAEIRQIKGIKDFDCYTFEGKKGIFVSARVHPGEVASSHMCNGFINYLFSQSPDAEKLLQACVFYIVPMINPDGVIAGNFRCDSQGKNLNRFYTNPSPDGEPEIFTIKTFLVEMITAHKINFCLDLHAHVNKQGVFMYGNSTGDLKEQLQVCLFPKLLEYNCKYFDYDACNFSEKNMSSKDKGDELSKEGASRVAIYKETSLPSCWTLQCNYNSARWTNICPKPTECDIKGKAISNGTILDLNSPEKKEEVALLNVQEFEEIGTNIAETILDYYQLRKVAPYFGSKLKNSFGFQLSLAVNILRMIPFRFNNDCRKIINSINSGQLLNDNLCKISEKIGLQPQTQFLSSKSMKEKSVSKQKQQTRLQSLKFINGNKQSIQKKGLKSQGKASSIGQQEKLQIKRVNNMIIIPKVPKKK